MAKELTSAEKQELASDLFYKMDSEGVSYYFTSYGPDYKSLEKLGFDIAKIKEAVKGANYLDTVHSKLEDMMGEDSNEFSDDEDEHLYPDEYEDGYDDEEFGELDFDEYDSEEDEDE